MANETFTIETHDGLKHEVPVFSADYIAVNRELEADGRRAGGVSRIEYVHRLAYRAGKRAGLVPADVSFEDWLETGVDATIVKESEETEEPGEAQATPAN